MKKDRISTRLMALLSICFLLGMAVGQFARAEAPPNSPEMIKMGKTQYDQTCAVCHGATGKGDGPTGKMLKPAPRDFSKGDFIQGSKPQDIFNSISNGVKSNPLMIAWKDAIKDEKTRWALTYYVMSLKK